MVLQNNYDLGLLPSEGGYVLAAYVCRSVCLSVYMVTSQVLSRSF